MKCIRCGTPVNLVYNQKFCTSCGYTLTQDTINYRVSTNSNSIDWENADQVGVTKSLLLTIKDLFFNPGVFFTKLSTTSNTSMAWLFAMIISSVSSTLALIWDYLPIGNSVFTSIFPDDVFSNSGSSSVYLFLTPLITTLEMSILSLYFQFLMLIFRVKKADLKSTFLILCYSQISSLAMLIPLGGEFISAIWFILLLVIGFHKAYNISRLRAVLLIFLPMIILLTVIIMFVIIFAVSGFVLGDLFKEILTIYR